MKTTELQTALTQAIHDTKVRGGIQVIDRELHPDQLKIRIKRLVLINDLLEKITEKELREILKRKEKDDGSKFLLF